jgi:MFS family permease
VTSEHTHHRWITHPNAILGAACLIAILILGPRSALGIFTNPICTTHGWGRDVFALAIAVQHLIWGLAQPAAGALADRYGSRRVIVTGACTYALGIALMPLSASPLAFQISAGVVIGFGLAGVGFPIVVAALGRLMPPQRRSAALGIATASGSIGQFLFAPTGQAFIAMYGWPVALWIMAGAVLAVVVLATPFAADAAGDTRSTVAQLNFRDAVAAAFGQRSYVLLVAGFFVCGFHVSFIMAHLPPYLTDIGVSARLAAWALSMIGLFNIVGAFSAGILGGHFSKRYLLSLLYALRALVIGAFLLSAKSEFAVTLFAAALGLLWLSTVPLTSGLVAVMFGTRYLGTLFGFVFMSHQAGAFLGVWLGGFFYELSGSYDAMWLAAIILALIAAALHWPIVERRAPGFAEAAVS